MNYVEPIRDVKKIAKMKKLMRKEGKLKELVLFEVAIKTGLRISDILNLRWSSVAREENGEIIFKSIITLKEIKTRKSKQFHLSDNVRSILKEFYQQTNPSINDYMLLRKSCLHVINIQGKLCQNISPSETSIISFFTKI